MKKIILFLIGISFALFCNAQFIFNPASKTITGYIGTSPTVLVIPGNISGVAVQIIGANAFQNQTSITSVTIDNSVLTIGTSAFYGCSELTSLNLGNSVTTIGNSAFQNTKLTSLTIPNSVITIGNNAFNTASVSNTLISLTLGNSLITIGDAAFKFAKITSVIIPNSVASIGQYAFGSNTILKTLTLGIGLTTIANNAFNSCTGLTTIIAKTPVPVNLTGNTLVFSGVNVFYCILYVPAASVDAYKTADIWKIFANISPMFISGQTNSYSYDYMNIRFDSINKSFVSPPNLYRLTQYFDNKSLSQVTESVLQSYGVGGVLTTVAYKDYLASDASYALARTNVDIATNKGMRAWIMDDRGYPSGAAGGLVVAGHPEYEARGVIRITKKGTDQVNISMVLPDTVNFFRASIASIVNGEPDYENARLVSIANNRINTIGLTGSWQLSVFGIIILDENTQAQSTMQQFGTTGHYPSLLSKNAVTRFIELTHQGYANNITNFNQKVDLFYSNEPNLMTTYWQYDGSKAQYAYIPWEAGLPAQFNALNGYDLLSRLDALFEGSSTSSKTIRTHFYQTVAELFSTNYSGQIRDWCSKNGLLSGGHLLLEEYLACHVIYYGDFIKAIRKFDVQGCDVPVARQSISDWHYWMPKFISSASYLENKNEMITALIDQIIGFGLTDLSPAIADLKRTVNMCFLMGINQFSSYMPYVDYTAPEFNDFTNYMARISLMMRGAQNEAPIAMYYPIETFQSNYIVSPNNHTAIVSKYGYLQATLDRMANDILSNGLDYNYVTADAILNASLNGNSVQVGSHMYSAIVMPRVEVIPLNVLKKLKSFSDAGVSIYWVDALPSLGTKNSEHTEVAAISTTLLVNNAPLTDLLRLKDNGFSIKVTSSAGKIWMSRSTRDNKRIYYIINESPSEITITATTSKSQMVQIYNPVNGQITEIYLPFSQKIAAYESVFLVEKINDSITESSIVNNDFIEPFSLFPNPASSEIKIKLPATYIGSPIKIITALGQEIDRDVVAGELFTKNISCYNKGFYFVQVAGKTMPFIKK